MLQMFQFEILSLSAPDTLYTVENFIDGDVTPSKDKLIGKLLLHVFLSLSGASTVFSVSAC